MNSNNMVVEMFMASPFAFALVVIALVGGVLGFLYIVMSKL